jgi:hypothetical protein
MRKAKPLLWLILPPLMVLLKDVIATLLMFATEPGITAKTHYYYSLALLPGSRIVDDALPAAIANVLLGALAGLAFFLCLRFVQRRRSTS